VVGETSNDILRREALGTSQMTFDKWLVIVLYFGTSGHAQDTFFHPGVNGDPSEFNA